MKSNRIVDEHKDLIYHVLHRTISDRALHPDLFQEIFLNVLRGMPRFRGDAHLSTWIYSVAYRTCLAHLKRSKSHMEESLEERREREAWEPVSSGEDEIAARLKRGRLESALGALALKHRLPLTLFYLEQRSYREIATILALPMGTVKTNLFRGLQELRKQLGGDLDDHL
ncbi:MAG: RNA polymerase sigma factor [bacterium]|nr:RNA polymerase sigma factor [bacterium]